MGRTIATRLYDKVLRTSVPSSMKTAWPRVSNTTFHDTVKWFTP